MMRGILVKALGDPHVMKLVDIPIPKILPKDVLVRVEYAGVNPVDAYIRAGTFGRSPILPFTPGKDGAGVVEQVGDHVQNVKPGDKVFFCAISASGVHGSYGELSVVTDAEVWPLPGGNMKEGAALGIPYLTAHRALIIKGKCAARETVLIHGASGAVGQACVQIAKREGLRVFATAGTNAGAEILNKLGADLVFDHKSASYGEEIKKNAPDGLDIVVEMRADLNLGTDCSLIGKNGRILVVGNRGSTQIDARFLMLPEASITGIALTTTTPEELQNGAQYVIEGVKDGWIRPNISKIYPLDFAPQAHQDIIESTTGATGKLLLQIKL